jgi:hypothetical protein
MSGKVQRVQCTAGAIGVARTGTARDDERRGSTTCAKR